MIQPNTTQIPNKLLNGEMQKMNKAELRIVLIVVRKTLGWIVDPETGMRKEEDWISRGQLVKLSSCDKKSISNAIDSCIKNGWIEARAQDGKLLDTKEKRVQLGRGGRIYYRLGEVFLGKIKREENPPRKIEKGGKIKGGKKRGENRAPTKETSQQKKPFLQKGAKNKFLLNINPIIDLFGQVNPSYKRLFSNKTQRQALSRLVEEHGEQRIIDIINFLPRNNQATFAPVITTPLQLEKKLGQMIAYWQKNKPVNNTPI